MIKAGTAMIPTAIPLNDSTPPTMSSAKTITMYVYRVSNLDENVVASTCRMLVPLLSVAAVLL